MFESLIEKYSSVLLYESGSHADLFEHLDNEPFDYLNNKPFDYLNDEFIFSNNEREGLLEDESQLEHERRYFNTIANGITNERRYFNTIANGITNESTLINESNGPKKLFNIELVNRNSPINEDLIGHKRRKFDYDNILSKVEVHFTNFINDYLNFFIDTFDDGKKITERFIKISHECMNNKSKVKFNEIIQKKVVEVISQDISSKFKYYPKDYNKKLCERLEKEIPIMKKILEQNYLTLFKNVYFPSKRDINLDKIYGINKIIHLTKEIKMFKDKIKTFDDEDYKIKMKKVVNEFYFEGKLKFL